MLKLLALAFSLNASVTPTAVAGLTAEELYKALLKAQDAQRFMQCDVTREELPEGAAQPKKVSGRLLVAKGGKARLEIKEPSEQKAVSDGKTLWVEMSDVKQVMKYDAAQLRSNGNFFLDLPSSIRYYAKASLKRLIPVGEGFDERKSSALELMPTDPGKAGFERMRVWVDTSDWVVRQVELSLDGIDNKVRFDNISKDPLPAETFKYRAPKGYEVFDLISMQ